MGLDQYAEFRKEPTKTFYWRKHAALQEYMERLWTDRTGQDASALNCQDLHLDEAVKAIERGETVIYSCWY
jgi:exonuclease VII small subunit